MITLKKYSARVETADAFFVFEYKAFDVLSAASSLGGQFMHRYGHDKWVEVVNNLNEVHITEIK